MYLEADQDRNRNGVASRFERLRILNRSRLSTVELAFDRILGREVVAIAIVRVVLDARAAVFERLGQPVHRGVAQCAQGHQHAELRRAQAGGPLGGALLFSP